MTARHLRYSSQCPLVCDSASAIELPAVCIGRQASVSPFPSIGYGVLASSASHHQTHSPLLSECFRQLPDEFTTEKFAQVFGYANNRSSQKTLERLIEDKAIEHTMRGNYKKLVSEL